MTGRSQIFTNLTIKQKIMIGIFLPVVLLAILGIVSFLSVRNITNTFVWVEHTQEVISKSEHVLLSAVDMETGLRGFLLAGKDRFLEPYEFGSKEAFETITSLKQKVDDNPKQVKRLDEIEQALHFWQKTIAIPSIELRKKVGSSLNAMTDVANLVGQEKGKKTFDKFRQIISEFQNEELSLMSSRKSESTGSVRNTNILIACISIIGLIVAWFFGKIAIRDSYQRTAALDNASTNMMVADQDYNIIYMNQTMVEMFRNAEVDIRKELSNFTAEQLIGVNMDEFHKDRSFQRNLMDNISGTRRGKIEVGGRIFSHIATPIIEGNRNRIGTVIEWDDITENVQMQNAVDSMVSAFIDGELDQRLATDSKIEFLSNLATSMNLLAETVEKALSEVQSSLRYLANGDLRNEIEDEYMGVFGELVDNSNRAIVDLRETTRSISLSAFEVSNASKEISVGSSDLAQRTEQQAAQLEETASAMEEIAATASQNAENAKEASNISTDLRAKADKGGEITNSAVKAMMKIEDSSQKISDIISVIDEIAFQTNLLALNAAVEAARAGDAGKGFAVVATEVGKLATRSSDAAKEIKELITGSEADVKTGVGLVSEAGKALEDIVESVGNVSDFVSEISVGSSQQSISIQEINSSLSRMDEMTQQNSALVEENTASAKAMEEQAELLNEAMSFFIIDEDGGGQEKGRPKKRAPLASAKRQESSTKKAGEKKKAKGRVKKKALPTGKSSKQEIIDDEGWEEF